MVSRRFISGLLLVLLAFIGTVAVLRQPDPPEEQAEVSPKREPGIPSARSEEVIKGWLGVVITEETLDVATRMDGRVESVNVQVGHSVRQGNVLLTLDARSLKEDLAIAEAALLSSKAEREVAMLALKQARERLRRRESPEQLRLQAISEEEVAAARYEQSMAAAKLEVARAKVMENEARVSQLRQQVAETSLQAPFDGIVAERHVHAGAVARAGQPLIRLLRQGKYQVRFAIPAQEMQTISVGQSVQVSVPDRGLTLSGQVVQIAPEVDVSTLIVFALANVEMDESLVVPTGTAVRVKLLEKQSRAGDD